MVLPHRPEYPYRRRILLATVGLGTIVVIFWPGLSTAQRIGGPCALILTSGICYGFVLIVLSVIGLLSTKMALVGAYFCFYAGVASLVAAPVPIWIAYEDTMASDFFLRVLLSSSVVPLMLSSAAGAYAFIDSRR